MRPCLIAATLLSRQFINDATTKRQIKPQHYLWKNSVCVLIINELVSKMDGNLTGPAPSSSSVHIIEHFRPFLLFWLISRGFLFRKLGWDCEEIASLENVFPLTTPHLIFCYFCAKSVEKMKQPSGLRAVRAVRVCVCVSDPNQSQVLTEAAARISRGTKKQILACRSLRCATASPRWWLSPRSVSDSFVLWLTIFDLIV